MVDSLPFLGVGIAYRSEIRDEVLAHSGEIDFLELITDHYIDMPPHKEAESRDLAARFPLVIHGVDCHEGTGAYSHPTVVSVETFRGLELVEVIVHELGHVLARDSKHHEGSLWMELAGQCRERERPVQFALQLFHLLLFHAGGEVVRGVLDREYVPIATRKRLYQKFGKTLGLTIDGERLEALCSCWGRSTPVDAAVAGLLDDLVATA